MNSLQPEQRSFYNYIKTGYTDASHRHFSPSQDGLARDASLIDDYILIFDDIIDGSIQRNGKPTAHYHSPTSPFLTLTSAIIHAQQYRYISTRALNHLIDISYVSTENALKIMHSIDDLVSDIAYGWDIEHQFIIYDRLEDIRSGSLRDIKGDFDKYCKMVELTTASHIFNGLKIGYVLANKNPPEQLKDVSIHLGMIRQIIDDFNDYSESHHEPCGDFAAGKGAPYIIFVNEMNLSGKYNPIADDLRSKLYADYRTMGESSDSIRAIIPQVKDLILNETVRKRLFEKCKEHHDALKSIPDEEWDAEPLYSKIITDYSILLK